jgi:hypothetical protein
MITRRFKRFRHWIWLKRLRWKIRRQYDACAMERNSWEDQWEQIRRRLLK